MRVRIIGEKAYLTLKKKGPGIARIEYEYPIPLKDASRIFDQFCNQGLIEKTRYELSYKQMVWVIDEFAKNNKGLIIAEVELENEEQQFDLPDWVGQEVTHAVKYLNINLAKYPFTKWEKEKPG